MATLRDLLEQLGGRSEVEAVYVVGRDGLLIDQAGSNGAVGEAVAAMAPNLLQSARELGSAARHESVSSAVIEYGDAVAVVADISSDVILVTFVRPDIPFGGLLFEIRNNRDQIAELV